MTSTGRGEPQPAAGPPTGPTGPTAAPPRHFRPELHGLRAVAVTLVVVYHVWFNRVSGGVDVFFVLTGFLLTGGLARAVGRGPVPVVRQWARSLGRLLPAAVPVLLTTVVVGMVVLPESRWMQTVREVVASALFLQNWQLAADAVDYAGQNNTASVVQHFWSLAIQVQVTLAVPVLVALLALTARAVGASPRRHMALALVGTFVLSLAYSVTLTAGDQPYAYFTTLTRLWEFALGGLLALVIDRVTLPVRLRVRLGWTGLVGLVTCGMVLQVSSLFPGYAALWPTGCAALVLLAGRTGSPHGVDRLLSSAPVRRLADLSYPLYLWHWPVLVFTLVATRREQLGPYSGAAVIALSLGLALVTDRLVERPLATRTTGVGGGRRIGAVGLVAVLVASMFWHAVALQRTVTDGTVGDGSHPGALARFDAVPVAGLLPPPAAVTEDWVRIEDWECSELDGFPTPLCAQPVTEPPQRRVLLVGDSHMQQFAGALEPIAASSGWQLMVMMLGACPFSTSSETLPDDPGCLAWNVVAADTIARLRPDAVVTLASRDVRVGRTETTPPGFVDRWWQLAELGIPVIAVRDNPRFDFSPPDCIQQLGRGARDCGIAKDTVYAPDPPYTHAGELPPNVTFIDLAEVVCDGDHCPAELGNVLVYMDDNHLTATFSRSMAPLIEGQVHGALGW